MSQAYADLKATVLFQLRAGVSLEDVASALAAVTADTLISMAAERCLPDQTALLVHTTALQSAFKDSHGLLELDDAEA